MSLCLQFWMGTLPKEIKPPRQAPRPLLFKYQVVVRPGLFCGDLHSEKGFLDGAVGGFEG